MKNGKVNIFINLGICIQWVEDIKESEAWEFNEALLSIWRSQQILYSTWASLRNNFA